MSIEALIWGLLPTIVALCAVFVSLSVALRERRIYHFVACAIVTAGVAWSLMILYRIIVLGAWPTFLPHLAIGVAWIIVILQTFLFRSKRQDVA